VLEPAVPPLLPPPLPPPLPPAPAPAPQQATAAPLPIVATRVLFSGDIAERSPAAPTFSPPTRSSAATPEAARFRIALDETGVVRYCFLARSSGDGALDEEARTALLRARFLPDAAHDLTWGTATIEWGDDIAAAPSAPEQQRAP
jgi:TonB family protein